jgi:putative phosphonate metabolism protein
VTFTRYAIYFSPPAEAEWVKFATSWLGWDTETGEDVAPPSVDGVDVAAVSEVPRKYGLHATMKPPFRLRHGQSVDALAEACTRLAQSQPPVTLDGLEIARLGRFLALRPLGDETALNTLAAACVRDLDSFRAPAPEAELERRRAAGLSPEQDANLVQWGYPYVMEAFRFHITLSSKLGKPTLATVQDALQTRLAPLLPAPFRITDLTLVGEAADGRFHLIHRYALSG